MKRTNGKRTFQIIPALVLAGRDGNYGYPTLTEAEALMAVQWIARRLLAWKTKRNIYDLLRTGGGIGNTGFPSIAFGESSAFGPMSPYDLLHYLLAKLANPNGHPDWVKFARKMLGFQGLEKPLTVRQRKPPGDWPEWLSHLHGVRLKQSPNKYHKHAWWLHGAVLGLTEDARRWQINITYSYRDEDSSWAIGITQKSGEKFEAFLARAWQWFEPQVKWRHDEQWYHRFFASPDGMKQSELKNLSDCERQLWKKSESLKSVFYWGRCDPRFDHQISSRLLRDMESCDQFREVRLIEMTDSRLKKIQRWIAADSARRTRKLKAKAKPQ